MYSGVSNQGCIVHAATYRMLLNFLAQRMRVNVNAFQWCQTLKNIALILEYHLDK